MYSQPGLDYRQYRAIDAAQQIRTVGDLQIRSGSTVYSRAEGLSGAAGMLGFAWNALREAVYGEHADHPLLVRYETLTANPLGTLAAIYDFIGEPLFTHDTEHTEPDYEAMEFDIRLRTPGLHAVGSAVPPSRGRRYCRPICSRGLRPMRLGRTLPNCRRRRGLSDRERVPLIPLLVRGRGIRVDGAALGGAAVAAGHTGLGLGGARGAPEH